MSPNPINPRALGVASRASRHPMQRASILRSTATLFTAVVVASAGLLLRNTAASAQSSNELTSPMTTGFTSPFTGLGLTDDQRQSIRSLSDQARAQRAAILGRQVAGALMSEPDQAALARIAAAHNEAVRALLSLEQASQLERAVALLASAAQRERAAARAVTTPFTSTSGTR